MEEKLTTTEKQSPLRKVLIVVGGFAVFVIAVVGVTILVSHIGGKQTSSQVAIVHITPQGFVPATLAVKAGTKIVWTNDDQTLHQIAANPFPKGTDLPSLKSQILNNSQNYSYVASASGSFGYHDQLHPTLNGTLVVKK